MKKILLFLMVVSALIVDAQQFEVVSLQQVKTGEREAAYHPRFMPNGKTLMVCDENYDGLGLVNMESQSYTHLTDMRGAGYKAVISEDGKTIVTREINVMEQKTTLYKLDLVNMELHSVMNDVDHVNNLDFVNGELSVAQGGATTRYRLNAAKLIYAPVKDVYVTEEDLKLVVYVSGVRNVIDPLSTEDYDAPYCWSSVSPNREKLLFVSGNDAYVSNIDGTDLVCLGMVHAPVWRGNDHVVGMEDYDDGHVFLGSDIVIVKADGTGKQKLTTNSSELNMYPSVSADGSKIAYHTGEGKIYLMTIKEK